MINLQGAVAQVHCMAIVISLQGAVVQTGSQYTMKEWPNLILVLRNYSFVPPSQRERKVFGVFSLFPIILKHSYGDVVFIIIIIVSNFISF